MPKISIIMPTYNRAGTFLKKAIASILSQTLNDFEVLIIDNGRDETQQLIASYNDPRLHYHNVGTNKGEYWSTNYGFAQAKSDYITWVHSDDMIPIDSLEERLNMMTSSPRLDFVHGDITQIDPEDEVIEKIDATDDTSLEVARLYVKQLLEGHMAYLVHHTTILMKRPFFDTVGPFDIHLPFGGDIDWMVRALHIGKFQRVPSILYLYRKHPESQTNLYLEHGIDKEAIRKLIGERYRNFL